jgi:ubiquinone/menaquinone biosynthesis C-methylase UbiE
MTPKSQTGGEEPRRPVGTSSAISEKQAEWRDIIRLIREFSGLRRSDRVLDVACGDGALTTELAQHCTYATGIDLSEDMIAGAVSRMLTTGLDNVSFQVGDAAHLEFAKSSFNEVYCRLALHHFPDPAAVLREIRRVLMSPGTLILVDVVSSEDPAWRETHNKIEKSRDPSHVAMLSPRQLRDLVSGAGFSIEREQRWATRRRFDDWVGRAKVDEGTADRTRRMLKDAADRKSTDLDIAVKGKAIEFTHRLLALAAIKLG